MCSGATTVNHTFITALALPFDSLSTVLSLVTVYSLLCVSMYMYMYSVYMCICVVFYIHVQRGHCAYWVLAIDYLVS